MKHPLFLSFLCCLKTQDFELLESFPTIAQDQKRKNSQGSIILLTISAWEKKKKSNCGPTFFTCNPTRSARLAFICEKFSLEKLESPLILFYFKGKIKQ